MFLLQCVDIDRRFSSGRSSCIIIVSSCASVMPPTKCELVIARYYIFVHAYCIIIYCMWIMPLEVMHLVVMTLCMTHLLMMYLSIMSSILTCHL